MENFDRADLRKLIDQAFKLPESYAEGSYVRPAVVALSNLAAVCQQLLNRVEMLESSKPAAGYLKLYLFYGPAPVYNDMITVLSHSEHEARTSAALTTSLLYRYDMIEVDLRPVYFSLAQLKGLALS